MATARPDNGVQQEFQLETRHLVLLVALVIVLCVASFMLGRWVERQSAGAPSPLAAAGRNGDANIEEMGDVSQQLTFFDTLKGGQAAPLKQPPAQARPQAPAPPVATETLPATSGLPSARAAGTAAGAPRTPASTTPATTSPSTTTPSSATPSTARRSVGEGVMIQVFASKDRASADAVRKRLRGKGYTALLVSDRGTWKVRVGPYADREEAQRAAATLREQEKLTTWIP